MGKKEQKTNAMRILDRAGVPYRVHRYATDGRPLDGVSVAALIEQDVSKIYKTLVAQGASRDHYVFIIPAAAELDLKKAAKAAGEKSMDMISAKDLLPVTGYVRGGCSPVGMKKALPTTLHPSALSLGSVIVSAGKIGRQVELSPADLIRTTQATVADITRAPS